MIFPIRGSSQRPSVTVGLYGGLGNQMFQYAMGRSLAILKGADLFLDMYGFQFDRYYRRTYELQHLNLPNETKSVRRPFMFRYTRILRRLSYEYSGFRRLGDGFALVEHSKQFDPSALCASLKHSLYIQGYWQDERYFRDIESTLRTEFTLKKRLSPANQLLANRIRSTNAVALHTRRLHGAADKPLTRQIALGESQGAVVPPSYYNDALEMVGAKVKDITLFVFSDHPPWAQEHLPTAFPTHFLQNDRGPAHEDLWLMALCKHHVIANSSFSWWGAWLAESDGQIVIAPRNAKPSPNIRSRWFQIA